MDVRDQFNLTAREYDKNRRNFIPCFDEFYIESTDFIIDYIKKPDMILDLGAGTGLLSEIWYNRLPKSRFILTDIADEMLNIARARFSGAPNVTIDIRDYAKELPESDFDAVISGLSIHHIEDDNKKELFSAIYKRLPDGGIFVNYDQFIADNILIENAYNEYWQNYINNSGIDKREQERGKERRKLDKECSVLNQLKMLEEAGFKADCIYSNKKFAVLAAVK